MKIVGFGDSITAGQYLAEQDTYLRMLGSRFGAGTFNAGVPGHTTADARERFARDVLAVRPDVCIVAFGMNDHVNVAPETPKTTLREFLDHLEYFCSELAGIGAFAVLCTVHPIIEGDESGYYYNRHPREWYVRPDGAQAWIDVYNAGIRRQAASRGIALADIDAAWRACEAAGASRGDMLRTLANSGAADGVHPTALGQKLYADEIGRILEPVLAPGAGSGKEEVKGEC